MHYHYTHPMDVGGYLSAMSVILFTGVSQAALG